MSGSKRSATGGFSITGSHAAIDGGEFDHSREAAEWIAERDGRTPSVALILGSGLGAYANTLEEAQRFPYAEIPHFHASTVAGHAGQLVVGTRHGLTIVAMQGRLHAYEGHSHAQVVFPLRTMWQLGARTLLVTNAAGGMGEGLHAGDLMLISDHINMTGRSPLIGVNDERFGTRFPDMIDAYDPELRAIAKSVAEGMKMKLLEGVYAGVLGPTYETPAEVRMLNAMGADAVGMSTVPEVIAARHMKMRVVGISCITNRAAGMGDDLLDHDDVQDVAKRARGRFTELVDRILGQLGGA